MCNFCPVPRCATRCEFRQAPGRLAAGPPESVCCAFESTPATGLRCSLLPRIRRLPSCMRMLRVWPNDASVVIDGEETSRNLCQTPIPLPCCSSGRLSSMRPARWTAESNSSSIAPCLCSTGLQTDTSASVPVGLTPRLLYYIYNYIFHILYIYSIENSFYHSFIHRAIGILIKLVRGRSRVKYHHSHHVLGVCATARLDGPAAWNGSSAHWICEFLPLLSHCHGRLTVALRVCFL